MTTIDTEIKFNRETKDYDCLVDGRYVGSRPSYSAGETLCNQVARDLILDGLVYSATELDGGSAPDQMAAEQPARYTRDSRFDKRFERGDVYSGDAWRDALGMLRWVEIGADPNVNNPIRV